MGYRNHVKRALATAESIYKRPVYSREVYYQLEKKFSFLAIPGVVFWAILDLYQNDEILADKSCDHFTLVRKYQKSATNPDSEYELYSDRAARLWPDYRYNKKGVLTPTERQATINFDTLQKLMMAQDTDKNRSEQEKFYSDLQPKFLDKKVSMIGNRIQMASFPRSGNSFLRRFIE